MLVKEIITRELHFDNCKQCEEYKETMKEFGYEILMSGSEDDWYFTCRKEFKPRRCKNINE